MATTHVYMLWRNKERNSQSDCIHEHLFTSDNKMLKMKFHTLNNGRVYSRGAMNLNINLQRVCIPTGKRRNCISTGTGSEHIANNQITF